VHDRWVVFEFAILLLISPPITSSFFVLFSEEVRLVVIVFGAVQPKLSCSTCTLRIAWLGGLPRLLVSFLAVVRVGYCCGWRKAKATSYRIMARRRKKGGGKRKDPPSAAAAGEQQRRHPDDPPQVVIPRNDSAGSEMSGIEGGGESGGNSRRQQQQEPPASSVTTPLSAATGSSTPNSRRESFGSTQPPRSDDGNSNNSPELAAQVRSFSNLLSRQRKAWSELVDTKSTKKAGTEEDNDDLESELQRLARSEEMLRLELEQFQNQNRTQQPGGGTVDPSSSSISSSTVLQGPTPTNPSGRMASTPPSLLSSPVMIDPEEADYDEYEEEESKQEIGAEDLLGDDSERLPAAQASPGVDLLQSIITSFEEPTYYDDNDDHDSTTPRTPPRTWAQGVSGAQAAVAAAASGSSSPATSSSSSEQSSSSGSVAPSTDATTDVDDEDEEGDVVLAPIDTTDPRFDDDELHHPQDDLPYRAAGTDHSFHDDQSHATGHSSHGTGHSHTTASSVSRATPLAKGVFTPSPSKTKKKQPDAPGTTPPPNAVTPQQQQKQKSELQMTPLAKGVYAIKEPSPPKSGGSSGEGSGSISGSSGSTEKQTNVVPVGEVVAAANVAEVVPSTPPRGGSASAAAATTTATSTPTRFGGAGQGRHPEDPPSPGSHRLRRDVTPPSSVAGSGSQRSGASSQKRRLFSNLRRKKTKDQASDNASMASSIETQEVESTALAAAAIGGAATAGAILASGGWAERPRPEDTSAAATAPVQTRGSLPATDATTPRKLFSSGTAQQQQAPPASAPTKMQNAAGETKTEEVKAEEELLPVDDAAQAEAAAIAAASLSPTAPDSPMRQQPRQQPQPDAETGGGAKDSEEPLSSSSTPGGKLFPGLWWGSSPSKKGTIAELPPPDVVEATETGVSGHDETIRSHLLDEGEDVGYIGEERVAPDLVPATPETPAPIDTPKTVKEKKQSDQEKNVGTPRKLFPIFSASTPQKETKREVKAHTAATLAAATATATAAVVSEPPPPSSITAEAEQDARQLGLYPSGAPAPQVAAAAATAATPPSDSAAVLPQSTPSPGGTTSDSSPDSADSNVRVKYVQEAPSPLVVKTATSDDQQTQTTTPGTVMSPQAFAGSNEEETGISAGKKDAETSSKKGLVFCSSACALYTVFFLIVAALIAAPVAVVKTRSSPVPVVPGTPSPTSDYGPIFPEPEPEGTMAPTNTQVPTGPPTITERPTGVPTQRPSLRASSASPTGAPSLLPSQTPSQEPSWTPTNSPSVQPTNVPTSAPTNAPSSIPTSRPVLTGAPTSRPSQPPAAQAELFDWLASISPDGGAALAVPGSPQYQAYEWLSGNPDLDSYSEGRLRQRYSLATLYYSANGDQWSVSSGWLSNGNECDWFSRSLRQPPCTPDNRFQRLDLYYNNLGGTIPEELALMSDTLQSIHLSGGPNQVLEGTIPSALGDATNLQQMRLNNNALEGTVPETLGALQSLQALDLSFNALTGQLFQNLNGNFDMPDLEWFSVANNRLRGTIPGMLGTSANKLWRVNLGNNLFTGSLPSELGLLRQLETLDVSSNQLTAELPGQLGSLPNLAILDVSDNLFGGTLSTEFGRLPKVESFNASFNELTGPIPSELGNLRNLRLLFDLSSNRFSGTIPPALGRINGRLRVMNLNDNRLTGNIPETFSQLTSLNLLSLQQTRLRGTMPEAVCRSFNVTMPAVFVDCPFVECACCSYCCGPNGNCKCRYQDVPSAEWACLY